MVAFGYDVTDAREREVRGKNQLAIGGQLRQQRFAVGYSFLAVVIIGNCLFGLRQRHNRAVRRVTNI